MLKLPRPPSRGRAAGHFPRWCLSRSHPPPPNKMSEFEEAKVVADPEVEVGGETFP